MSTRVFTYGGFSPNESFSVDEEISNQQINNLPDFSAMNQFQIPGTIIQIVCGQSHIVALSNDGNLFTFGSNQFGQRGSATQQVNLPKIRSIAAGIYHTVALSTDDKLYIWGRGTEGQLGLNNFECYEDPQEALSSVEKIYCGGFHTIIIKKDRKIYVTGDNSHGQLGIEQQTNYINKFQTITLPDPILDVSAGLEHTIFLTSSKDVYACGNNLFGQCGIENLQQTKKPIKLNLNTPISRIFASSGTFSAAINEQDQILLWGTGSWGYARKPTLLNEICSNLPQKQISDITMGDNYAIITFKDNQPLILGSNHLPDMEGETKNILEPLTIPSGEKFICGQKLVITLKYETDIIVPEPKKSKAVCPAPKSKPSETNKNDYYQIAKLSSSNTVSKSQLSPPSCNCKEIQIQNQNLQRSLRSSQDETEKLKKELEYTKNLLKQKDDQILQLTSKVTKFETDQFKKPKQQMKIEESLIQPQDPLELKDQQFLHRQEKNNYQIQDPIEMKELFFENRVEKRSGSVQHDDVFRSLVQQKRVQQQQQPEKLNPVEESFTLSRYNFKTIRSITPIDMRQSDLMITSLLDQTIQQSQTQIQEAQGINDSAQKIKKEFDKTNIKYYTRGQLQGQQVQTQPYQPLPPKISEKPFEYKNYVNTSIIDKIQNFQKTVGKIIGKLFSQESAASINRKHYRVGSSGGELYQQKDQGQIKPQLQYRFSVCEENETIPKSYYKPYEDYYRLRG